MTERRKKKNASRDSKIDFAPKTAGQKELYQSIMENEIIITSGPAGCGKSFIMLVAAVEMIRSGNYDKIMLVRPAVASEKLGFLPGTESEKIRPYMRPMYDNLRKIVGAQEAQKMIEHQVIEEVTLGYMRGMSIDDTIVILDEAQNATDEQVLMFLSRIGSNSVMLVNGDTDQIDLRGQKSGLMTALEILTDIPGIAIVTLNESDIVRNPIIQSITKRFRAYKHFNEQAENSYRPNKMPKSDRKPSDSDRKPIDSQTGLEIDVD